MLQKLTVGVLAFTVIGAAGAGVYSAAQDDPIEAQAAVLAESAGVAPAAEQPIVPESAAQLAPTATPEAAAVPGAGDGTGPVQIEQQQALNQVGEPWSAAGTIAAFDIAGMTLTLADGTQIYVELGPSYYWQSQAVTLAVGDVVTVDGFYNGDQYHAAAVTTSDGATLAVRTEDGLPLWAGGAGGGQAQAGAGNGNTAGQAQTQVAAEDWITTEATVIAANASTLQVQTAAGEQWSVQLGQASFMASQGVSFAAGDAIALTGFWQGTTFRAGDITKLATGERLMLLDPNGRPLWGGPGRAGAQGQSGAGGAAGAAQGQSAGAQSGTGLGQGGQGQGGQGQGGGKGYRGGRS